jgi:tRNA A-37 threonylcarbamoyl transferase component Bud32
MWGSLGEKIGEGAMADVHAWAPGQVVKLFKAGVSRRVSRHEAQKTRAVFAAGVPAPEVFDEVTLDGRFGFVLQRLDGPTLLQLLQTGLMKPEQAGAIIATLYMSVHQARPPAEALFLRDWVDLAARGSAGKIPEHIATGVLALIDRLQPGDGLCHGDLHCGNVIMTAEGPRIVDWTAAYRAPAVLDLGRSHLTLTEFMPDDYEAPERPPALNVAVQSEYARLAGMSPAALRAAIEPYLPVLRAFALAEPWGFSPALRQRLIQRIEAALGSEGA